MKQLYIFLLGGLLLLGSACNIINPAEPVPSYVHIQKIDLATDASTEGSNSSKITDAWVYMDGQLLGCFELPVTFPVIGTGVHNFVVKAGIKVNGIAATRAPYPFFANYNTTLTLTQGQVTTVSPVVRYLTGLNWTGSNGILTENFDGSGIKLYPSHYAGVDTLAFNQIKSGHGHDEDIFEGTGAGAAYLNNTTSIYAETVTDELELPGGESSVFLEMNYKCNYPFTIGMTAYSSGTTARVSIINLHSTNNTWNKVYIYLTPGITGTGNAPLYTVFIGMLNNDNTPNPYFAIDNLKLIHY